MGTRLSWRCERYERYSRSPWARPGSAYRCSLVRSVSTSTAKGEVLRRLTSSTEWPQCAGGDALDVSVGGTESGGSDALAPSSDGGDSGGDLAMGCDALDPVTPPGSRDELEAWINCFETEDWEKQWVCEQEFTDKSSSVHPVNRVCNNPELSGATLSGDEQLPVGVAALKQVTSGEWYVEVKVAADSGSGEGWYWRSPGGGSQGLGDSSSVSFCAGCHADAGNGEGLGDFVFEQIIQ